MSGLRATRLSVQLGEVRAVQEVSATFERGEFWAIIGPNGAGKSTLLRALLGLLAPSSGEVHLGERPLSRYSRRERARQLAYLAQTETLPPDAKVEDVVALGRGAGQWLWGLLPANPLSLGGLSHADDAAVARAMQRTGTQALAERVVGQLSGGEAQRVALARALAAEPDFLLLDEPTNHLDLAYAVQLVRALQAEAQAGLGVVAVLHDLNLAARADKVMLLSHGQVVAAGPPLTVLTPQHLGAVYGLSVEVLCHEGRAVVVPH